MQPETDKPNKGLNCGSCAHLTRERASGLEAKCEALGRIPSSRACSKHKPDAFTLLQDKEQRVEGIMDLAKILRSMSVNDLQIFAAIMLNEKRTRRYGFTFMQKVYIRVAGSSGRSYLSNFVLGYVIDADKDWIRVVSETGRIAIELPNEKNSQTLYTIEQFNPIRKEIYANRNWYDPELAFARAKLNRSMLTLDQADDLGMLDTKSAKRRKIKKVKQADDLVSFVAKMGRGVVKARKREDAFDETITVAW